MPQARMFTGPRAMQDRIAAADLGIVIPFRHDRPERLDNLSAVLRHLTTTLADAEILVIEDGAQIHAAALCHDLGVRHIARPNTGAFHRTRILNQGIESLLTRRFAASYDTDVLIYPQAWQQALAGLRAGRAVVFPYDGRFCDARGALRASLLANPDLGHIPADQAQAAPSKGKGDLVCINPNSVGGVVLFDRATYRACGGYHEAFVGWGFEDAEIMARMGKLGHAFHRIAEVPLIHLSHPRGRSWAAASWYGASRRNNALFRAMGRLSAAQLTDLIAAGELRCASPPAPKPGLLAQILRWKG